jgi:chromosome segregation ATPase
MDSTIITTNSIVYNDFLVNYSKYESETEQKLANLQDKYDDLLLEVHQKDTKLVQVLQQVKDSNIKFNSQIQEKDVIISDLYKNLASLQLSFDVLNNNYQNTRDDLLKLADENTALIQKLHDNFNELKKLSTNIEKVKYEKNKSIKQLEKTNLNYSNQIEKLIHEINHLKTYKTFDITIDIDEFLGINSENKEEIENKKNNNYLLEDNEIYSDDFENFDDESSIV